MADAPLINPISCKRCRVKKIRCDRRLPGCNRCQEQDTECVYVRRVPRKPVITTGDRVGSIEATLDTILQRLDRIEQNCRCQNLQSQLDDSPEFHASPEDAFQNQSELDFAIDAGSGVKSDPPFPVIPLTSVSGGNVASEHSESSSAASDPNAPLPVLRRQFTSASDNAKTMSKLYHRCLNAASAWEPQATGTTTDFIAAFFMVRVAAERFDIELSWNMFKLGCQYAEKIELHRLDNDPNSHATNLDKSVLNAGRKGFWELVTMDVYFRLIHNKPPAIMACRPEAKVNLPWLAEPGSQVEEETTTTIRFLIDSRRTFILLDFLQLLEDSEGRPDPELVSKTEALCRDIEALYEQWGIDDWVKKMIDSDGQLWTIAGVALEGYTCIIFMLRRALSVHSGIPENQALGLEVVNHPLVLNASRHILEIVALLLVAIPSMGAVAVTFVVLQAHIPLACLATYLLHPVASHDCETDIILLEHVAEATREISRDVEELVPLTAAMEELKTKVRNTVGDNVAR
ncbi:Hypothetical protein NCS54_01378400 [Fusarium falciforme]|uniref:Hypothetical protein n=1 Tax=Fusarium falciforme TaxID=195108 RepID=UPI0022FFD8A1|nr:Hypothetical protein NCS54_01378400 [Fusarium falciforme]WAO96122.1 Hypothetical protein NCS54_01378400 [Fusarium falciforme]